MAEAFKITDNRRLGQTERLFDELKALPTEAALKRLAAMIPDNAAFRNFLTGLAPENMRRAYDELKPHLRFKVHSFLFMRRLN